jgi:hypothetical protein
MDPFDLQMFVEDTRRVVPNFEVRYKDSSWVQKLLGFFLGFFSSGYMTKFTTTLYPNVYFPSEAFYKEDAGKSFAILAHERIHLLDTQSNPIWFRVSYLLPQLLCVPFIALGFLFLSLSWWVSGIFLVLGILSLLPWPSPWRVAIERRGYAANLAITYWVTGKVPSKLVGKIYDHFVNSDYYWMSWGQASVNAWLDSVQTSLRDGTLKREAPYSSIYIFLKTQGLLDERV